MDAPAQDNRGGSSWWFLIHTKLYRYRALLRKYWWIVLVTTAIGTSVAAWNASQQHTVYTSTGRLIVSGKIALPETATYSEETGSYFGTQIQLMQSAEVRSRAEARVKAMDPSIQPIPVSLDVGIAPNAAIFVLKTSGSAPEYTRRVLDAVMKEYIEMKNEMRSTKTEETETKIVDQVGRMEKEWVESQEELIDFQKRNNIGFLQEEGNSAGAYLSELNRQLSELRTEGKLLEMLDLDQNIERQQKNRPNDGEKGNQPGVTFGGSGPEAEYVKALQEIRVLRAQREDFSKDLRPKHPIIVDLDQRIAQQEMLIRTFREQSLEQLKTRRESLKLQVSNLESVIKEQEKKALDLSERLAQYNIIQSKVERKKAAFDRLLLSRDNLKVNRQIEQDIVSILERASPAVPVRPGMTNNVLAGCLFGAIFGFALLLLMDQLDDRVASFAEFQSRFRDRVLAQIPRQRGQGELAHLALEDDRHAFAEAFRSLRSSIFFMPVSGAPPKTFLVTSSVPNEGKSTTSINLAVTMALSDTRVLLVDGDLRRGELHAQFGLPLSRGFGDVLSGKVPLSEALQSTEFPNLTLLSRGASVSNPGELYLSKVTDQFLKLVYDQFDYILIDSSPVMAADDTTSLAPKMDATLFVFRFTHSSSRVSRKAIDLLRDRQANILGVVCNDVDEAMQEYHYYRYPEYYGTKQNG